MDTATAQTRLEDLLADLEGEIETLEGENAHEDSELSHVDQHPADNASLISEADREDAMLEELAARKIAVQAALERVAEGSYGVCVDCGRSIPDERLEAIPEALRCIDDQRRFDAAS